MKITTVSKFTHQGQELTGCAVKLVEVPITSNDVFEGNIDDELSLFRHIFVSTNEELKEGNIVYHELKRGCLSIGDIIGETVYSHGGNNYERVYCKKIIAQSQDLSPQTLQDISAGKINEQGEYWLVCEEIDFELGINGERSFLPQYQLKLMNNHVTVVEKEKKLDLVKMDNDITKLLNSMSDKEWVELKDKMSNSRRLLENKEQESWSSSKLQTQFFKEKGIEAFNSQGEPDIDYVSWLESKISVTSKEK